MGVNCSVRLNEGAEWEKVGQVACVLLGATVSRAPLGKDGWRAVVDGFDRRDSQANKVASRLLGKPAPAKYFATHTPEYIHILITGDESNPVAKLIEQSDSMPYSLWYGLESRFLYPKASAAKIALAEGITKFFGGRIVYNDCSDQKHTFRSPHDFKNYDNDATFYRYQTALEELKPLTAKDIKRCEKYAAY